MRTHAPHLAGRSRVWVAAIYAFAELGHTRKVAHDFLAEGLHLGSDGRLLRRSQRLFGAALASLAACQRGNSRHRVEEQARVVRLRGLELAEELRPHAR